MARKSATQRAGRARTARSNGHGDGDGRATATRARPQREPKWKLRLYIAGQSPKSVTALTNLKRLCEERLPDRHHIEVIDLQRHPHLAANDGVVAIPTLVRRLPPPMRKIIGDLSDRDRALLNLNLL